MTRRIVRPEAHEQGGYTYPGAFLNKTKIANLKGKHVRLRPMARRFDSQKNELELAQIDNLWFVPDAGRFGVTIENSGYGHRLELSADQIVEFRTDPSEVGYGFLILKGQVWVCGQNAGVDPIQPEPNKERRGS